MESFSGGSSSKGIMEAISAHRKTLEAAHGPAVSRKLLQKVRSDVTRVKVEIEKGRLVQALADASKLDGTVEKAPDAIKKVAAEAAEAIAEAVSRELDELEGMISAGDGKDAARELSALARACKGSKFEARANELLEKARA
jgi:hypothetical protein